MQRKVWYGWMIGLWVGLASCQGDGVQPEVEAVDLRQLSTEEKELVTSINAFAFDLMRDLAEHRPQDNVFFSPYGINLALSMTLNGASTATLHDLHEGLDHRVISPSEINKAYSQLTPFLQQLDQQVDFTLATGLWYDRHLRTDPLAHDIISAYYGANVSDLTFGRRKSPGIINEWVQDQTQGRIAGLVEQLHPNASLYVTSAVHFAGDWAATFQETHTGPGVFHLPDGTTTTADMMVAPRAEYHLYRDPQKTIIDIPYGNQQYSMTLVMPQQQDSLTSLVRQLDAPTFRQYLSQMDTLNSNLYLPKFSIEYQTSLKPVLSRLGMGITFSDSADFSRLFIDPAAPVPLFDVLHKAVISVDETGTKAVTSTVTQAESTASDESLHIDRSFLFFIRENHTGVIVFAGRLSHPNPTTPSPSAD